MDTIQELQNFRTQLIQQINVQFDDLIQKIRTEQDTTESVPDIRNYESVYPLTTATAVFKGKKPTGVIFSDQTREDVSTWKRAVKVVLKKCNSDGAKHRKLLELRGKVAGRNRIFLGKSAESMRSPLKIDQDLWVETHYDTETLLRILKVHILEPVGYDYSGITITIRNN